MGNHPHGGKGEERPDSAPETLETEMADVASRVGAKLGKAALAWLNEALPRAMRPVATYVSTVVLGVSTVAVSSTRPACELLGICRSEATPERWIGLAREPDGAKRCAAQDSATIDKYLSVGANYPATPSQEVWHLNRDGENFAGTLFYSPGDEKSGHGRPITGRMGAGPTPGAFSGLLQQDDAHTVYYLQSNGKYLVGREFEKDCTVGAVLDCPYVFGPADKAIDMAKDPVLTGNCKRVEGLRFG